MNADYLVSYGKSGGLGRFAAADVPALRRGASVLLRTPRGLEIGAVRCAASDAHIRMLNAPASGQLLRCVTADDLAAREAARSLEQRAFEKSRELVSALQLPIEILDIEIPLERQQAILQFLGAAACDVSAFVETLSRELNLVVQMEDLAVPQAKEEEHGGCGEPNCGRASGGGCTSCSSGGCSSGSCSSAGAKSFDIRQYFGHLREKMEQNGRVALVK